MSMRILDLQRRLREVGRIRIGEQVATSNGKRRPAKLEVFRLTSRDRSVIEAAAEAYGGTVEPWQSPDGEQWEVKTTTAEMPVTVPPGDMAFSQAYEQWTAGGCRVRCDGRWDHVGDKACHCDPSARACDIHTRLSVILHELPGLGVWRLDTSGYYAAVELGGVVDLAVGHAEAGRMLPARLRLEQRSVKRFDASGKAQTRRFTVPVLDLDVHPMALASGGSMAAIEAPVGAPRFEPVPELPAPPVAPVADQVPELGAGRPPRRNAAAPIPSTGVKPRSASDAAAAGDLAPPAMPAKKAPAKKAPARKKAAPKASMPDVDTGAIQARIDGLDPDERADLGAWWKGEGIPPLASGEVTVEQAAAIHAAIDAYQPGPSADARNKKMWALAAEVWPEEDRDERRKALISVVTDGRTKSSKDLSDEEWTGLFDGLEVLKSGSMELFQRASGEWELRRAGS